MTTDDIPAFNREMLKLFARSPAELEQEVVAALQQRGSDLFSRPPGIERIDVLACKLP